MSSTPNSAPPPHTVTSVYRNTTLGITLQQALEQFSEGHSIPQSLHSEILGKFDNLMCEMLSNARVTSSGSSDSTTPIKKEPNTTASQQQPHGALKYNLLSSSAIHLAHPEIQPPLQIPMAPIAQTAKFRHGQVEMYRYVNKCYEFVLRDVEVELDVSGRGQNALSGISKAQQLEEQLATSRYNLADQTIKLESEKLKIVAIRTSDILRANVNAKKGKKRKRAVDEE